jgi:hypothetical protein
MALRTRKANARFNNLILNDLPFLSPFVLLVTFVVNFVLVYAVLRIPHAWDIGAR